MSTTTRTNRHPGTCTRCHGHVPADAGTLNRTSTGWAVTHLECPDAPAPAAASIQRVTTDGIYSTDDGTIYKVQQARQGSGRLYAKRLQLTRCTDPGCGHPTTLADDGTHQHGHFVYAAGAIHTLRADQKMTLEQAAVFGRLYGVCVRCGADLTDENSIARGIGPICAGRF